MSKKYIDIKIYDGDDEIKYVRHQDMLKLLEQIRIRQEEKDKEIERLNNIINELEKLELYEYTPDYDYDENLVEGYTPFNIENYIEETKGSNKE